MSSSYANRLDRLDGAIRPTTPVRGIMHYDDVVAALSACGCH